MGDNFPRPVRRWQVRCDRTDCSRQHGPTQGALLWRRYSITDCPGNRQRFHYLGYLRDFYGGHACGERYGIAPCLARGRTVRPRPPRARHFGLPRVCHHSAWIAEGPDWTPTTVRRRHQGNGTSARRLNNRASWTGFLGFQDAQCSLPTPCLPCIDTETRKTRQRTARNQDSETYKDSNRLLQMKGAGSA